MGMAGPIPCRLTWPVSGYSSAWSGRTVWPSSASTPPSGSSQRWAPCLQGELWGLAESRGGGAVQGLERGPTLPPHPTSSRRPSAELLGEPCLLGWGGGWGALWGWAGEWGGHLHLPDPKPGSLQRHCHRHLHNQLPRGLPVHCAGLPRQRHRGGHAEAAGEDPKGLREGIGLRGLKLSVLGDLRLAKDSLTSGHNPHALTGHRTEAQKVPGTCPMSLHKRVTGPGLEHSATPRSPVTYSGPGPLWGQGPVPGRASCPEVVGGRRAGCQDRARAWRACGASWSFSGG